MLVAQPPEPALAARRVDAGDEVMRADLGTVLLGARDVGDVDGVLGAHRAPDVTPPEVLAALLRDAAERVGAIAAEVDRERQAKGLCAGVSARGGEGADLVQRWVVRRGARFQRLLGLVIPRVKR